MRTSKWSLVGYIAGFIFALVSFLQYYVLYRDIDKIIAYPIIGLLICMVAWLYNKQLNQGNTLMAIEDYLADRK